MKRKYPVLTFMLLIISLVIIASAVPVTAEICDPFSYTVSGGEAIITRYNSSISGELVIPSSVNGYPVTGIGDRAFYNCINLTDVIIPDGVASIGSWAFSRCNSLKTILIPDSVTNIGDSAFYLCNSLISVNIPDGVTSINDWAFYHCSDLENIILPDSVESIGNYAFSSCYNLTDIYIPGNVTNIGAGAFYLCSGLIDITVPDGVTKIEYGTFYHCNSLTNIKIPDSVSSIGNYAFSCCDALTGIEIPDGVTNIGDYAFYLCNNLYNITIPSSLISIGDWAFFGRIGSRYIYYKGSNDKWQNISIGEYNTCFNDKNVYYNQNEYVDTTYFVATKIGDIIMVNVNAANYLKDSYVYVATYDIFGKMLEIKELVLQDENMSDGFNIIDVYSVKAFVWNENLNPLLKSKEIIVE